MNYNIIPWHHDCEMCDLERADRNAQIFAEHWADVLATLCSAFRKLGAEADWDGEVVWVKWPDGPPIRIEISIAGRRLLTA